MTTTRPYLQTVDDHALPTTTWYYSTHIQSTDYSPIPQTYFPTTLTSTSVQFGVSRTKLAVTSSSIAILGGTPVPRYGVTTSNLSSLDITSSDGFIQNYTLMEGFRPDLDDDVLGAGDWVRDILLGFLLAMLCLLTFVGNAMVLHAVRTDKRLQTVSNMFIVSLAIADLIVGLIVMPMSSIYIFTEDWLLGLEVCQLWICVDYTASTASILNLFILSLDRYWSVTAPLKYLRRRTKRRALVMISLVWFVSSLWLIPIVGWHHFEHGGERKVPPDVCDTEYAKNTALKIITGIFNYYLPLAIMYGLYTKIFMEIRQRSKMEIGQRISSGNMKENTFASSTTESEEEVLRTKGSNRTQIYSNHYITGRSDCKQLLNKDVSKSQINTRSKPLDICEQTETDATDDEQTRLHNDDCTNISFRVLPAYTTDDMNTCTSSLDVGSSESDTKNKHFCDEDKYNITENGAKDCLYEQHQLPLISGVPPDVTEVKMAETSLCSLPIPPNLKTAEHVGVPTSKNHPVILIKDVRFQLCNNESKLENQFTFPKEAHPFKTKYVNRKNNYSCYSESDNTEDPRLPRPKSKHLQKKSKDRNKVRNNRRDSALIKQAVRWRKKIEKKKHKPSSALYKEIKAIRQLGVIMGAFTVCFLPYFVCFMVVAFCSNCVSSDLMTIVTWFGYLNSTLNPFLYPLCNTHFRRKFRKMLNLKSGEKARYCDSARYSVKQNIAHSSVRK